MDNRTIGGVVDDFFSNHPRLEQKIKDDSRSLQLANQVRNLFKKDAVYLALLSYLNINKNASYSELQKYFPKTNIKKKITDLERLGLLVAK